ncbi:MAG: response regulator transcription factor [Acidobacteriaceae bacterium]|nr:response regulator transcription factor [Acidobacteriaceae bacterium]
MIRVVLVDDEPPACRKLRHLLANEPDFSVVGEAVSGAEAVETINRLQPQLVFLDIQLPDCSGFDVVESLENRQVQIVFVTAYDDFALRAFEVHALDYLLKPVDPSRFAQALTRVRSTVPRPGQFDKLVASLRSEHTYVRRLLIQENGRSVFLEAHRIDWIEAARNYLCIHSGGKTYILRSSLESFSAKLDPAMFQRINRSEVANVSFISELRTGTHGDAKVHLKDGTELRWSRRYRTGALEDLERK